MNPVTWLYNTNVVKSALTNIGVDLFVRNKWRIWKEWSGENKTITIGEDSAEFPTYCLIEDRYLKQEIEILKDLLPRLQKGDVFFDVGADAGLYSILAGKCLSNSGSVVAFEPHPIRRQSLYRNASRNKTPIEIRSEALANVDGTAELNYSLDLHDSPTNQGSNDDSITVKTASGDRLINEGAIPGPDVMKIDVEGAELNVLLGLEEYLSERECRLIYVEIHDKIEEFGHTEGSLVNMLNGLDYELTELATRSEGNYRERFIRAKNL